ncbi:MAG: GGDEF domain-containing protein [Lachnospiraceae bacterium]|nr:GGDEF domain-containing protein [Lachnospiraceae bacterium]
MKKTQITTKVRKSAYVVACYIMLLAMIPATIIFSNMVGNKLGEHIRHTIRDSAGLCTEMIERQYESDMLMLEGLAVRMATSFENDPVLAMERLVSTAERYGMKRLAFSYADGVTLTTDRVEMNLTGVDNFERALKGERLLTTVIPDISDGGPVNMYSMPVYKSGTAEILGVMSAVFYSDMFENLLSASSFDGEGYTYIIDSSGNVVVNSNHKNALKNMTNLFQYMEEQGNKRKTIKNLRDSVQIIGEGFFEIRQKNGDNMFAYYTGLDINDWYVVSVVPKTVAESTKTAVMFSVVVYCVVISAIALIVVMSIRHVLREKNRQLKKALYEDELTGGRSYEKFRLDCRKRMNKETQEKAACIFLDIDNFNLVSTLYGSEESVDTIRRVYAMIQSCVGENGIIGRNSADQFCVMFFYTDRAQLEYSIKAFKETLRENAKFENMLRPSMGIYVVEDFKESIDDMVNKAKTAHETIKRNSSSATAYYDASFRDRMYENRHLEDEMEHALEKHEFVSYLQPKYNAGTGRICGAEALIRWITSDGTVIPPGKFIPLAENNGFVRQLDREMFYMVCRLQKKLKEEGITPVPISVNVSRQLLYDKTFAEDYYNYIRDLGLSTELVELEITESALFEDINLFRSTLEKLRGYGFRILMDDFGTGYSSLMMLNTVPIDIMKLDKSFIDDYADEKGSCIIQCVLNLAKMLGIPVVAEGVETEEQYHYLKNIGCEYIQGYFFSKPVPPEDYVTKLG